MKLLEWLKDYFFLFHQITDLLDVVLDSFIKTSATGGLGSIKAEVMADTAVALASGNVKLVSSKVITFPLPSGPLFLCLLV